MKSANAMSLDFFAQQVGRLPQPVKNAVRKSNRQYANVLRDAIRVAAPATGASASWREGRKHDTRHGAIKRSIVGRGSANYAYVRGGNSKAPHFMVHEFGGGVFWTRATSSKSARDMFGHVSSKDIAARLGARGVKGHVIPVKTRQPNVASPLGGGKHGAGSYFFFRTAAKHVPHIQDEATDAAVRVIHEMLGTGSAASLAA